MSLIGFPLLLIPFAIYNIVAFLMPGVGWAGPLTSVSTRIGIRTVVDHALSLVLFLAMLVEFLLLKQAATGTFFLLLVISFVDVLGGFSVTLRSAQRDLTVEGIEHVSS